MTTTHALYLLLLASAALAAPRPQRRRMTPEEKSQLRAEEEQAAILEQDLEKQDDGGYSLSFRTENGISQQERGTSYPGFLEESGTYVKEGTITYILDGGIPVELQYVADENGYEIINPEALKLILPTPPPTQYPLPKVPGAGMAVPQPLPEFNPGLREIGGTVSPSY